MALSEVTTYHEGMPLEEEHKDFEFERRFFCRNLPEKLTSGETPTLIVQSYYVHEDNYALRIRLQADDHELDMNSKTDALHTLLETGDHFTAASMTAKGPSVGGTRYEAERAIDIGIAQELMLRGGSPIVKNRYGIWLDEDWWNLDVFGGENAPLVVAEVERSGPVTDLTIPDFCLTEITDDPRFSNDGLANKPFSLWADDFDRELTESGPHFMSNFGHNRTEGNPDNR